MTEGSLLAVTAIGNDRPGIVAAVTKVLYEHGCNLEDATSTILRGHFAITLVVRSGERGAAGLEADLAPIAEDLGLVVTVRPVEEADTGVVEPTHVVSVYGGDRPGIVYRVSEALAGTGANVTALSSRVIGGDRPVYALLMEVATRAEDEMTAALEALREELDVDVSVHPMRSDVL
jgi:glycine cleavage system transcriptional repressor